MAQGDPQESAALREAKEQRSKLERKLLSVCKTFENETGLIVRDLTVLRAPPNPSMPYRESDSLLFAIDVSVGL